MQCVVNIFIRERNQRRLARELLKEDYFDTWITVEQDQDQDQDQLQAQMPARIQDQELDQDTKPQKRQYSSEALDSTDLTERRYPLRKRQLTVKAAALIIE
jgi:hypothetical protein